MNRGSVPHTNCPTQVNRHSSPNTKIVRLLMHERTANNMTSHEMNREIILFIHCTRLISQHWPPNTELVHRSVYIRTACSATAKDEHRSNTTHDLTCATRIDS